MCVDLNRWTASILRYLHEFNGSRYNIIVLLEWIQTFTIDSHLTDSTNAPTRRWSSTERPSLGGTIATADRVTFGAATTPKRTCASAESTAAASIRISGATATPSAAKRRSIPVRTIEKKTVPQTKMEENEKRIFHTGAVTNKMLLPVTALNFGRTWSKASSGRYTLGPLECSGSVASAPAGIPESCGQLQRIGHHLPALYQIRRNGATGTVYCDLTRQPGDQGIDWHWLIDTYPIRFARSSSIEHSRRIENVSNRVSVFSHNNLNYPYLKIKVICDKFIDYLLILDPFYPIALRVFWANFLKDVLFDLKKRLETLGQRWLLILYGIWFSSVAHSGIVLPL